MSGRLSLLALASLAGLAACQATPQEAARPDRPVLVQTVAFEPRAAERSFVATIRPRIESDLGFRVAGKVARAPRRCRRHGQGRRHPRHPRRDRPAPPARAGGGGEPRRRRPPSSRPRPSSSASRPDAQDGWSTAAGLDRQKAATEEARGRVARAERALSLAAERPLLRDPRADADGVVTATEIEPGQVVAAGQAAIRIARLDEKEAVIAVPEAQIAAVRSGGATITLWSEPGQALRRPRCASCRPAPIRRRAPISPASRSPDADEAVELGMTATVTIGDEPAATASPACRSRPLFNQGDGPAVWVVDVDGRPALRPVDVAAYEAPDVLSRAACRRRERRDARRAEARPRPARPRSSSALRF